MKEGREYERNEVAVWREGEAEREKIASNFPSVYTSYCSLSLSDHLPLMC